MWLRTTDFKMQIRSRWNRDRYICIPIILKRYNVSMKPWSLHLYPCWTVSIVNRRHRHIIACWCIAALTAMTKRTKADMVLLHITNRKKNLRINTQMLAVASCTRWRGLRPSVSRVQILWPCVRTQGLQAAPRQPQHEPFAFFLFFCRRVMNRICTKNGFRIGRPSCQQQEHGCPSSSTQPCR